MKMNYSTISVINCNRGNITNHIKWIKNTNAHNFCKVMLQTGLKRKTQKGTYSMSSSCWRYCGFCSIPKKNILTQTSDSLNLWISIRQNRIDDKLLNLPKIKQNQKLQVARNTNPTNCSKESKGKKMSAQKSISINKYIKECIERKGRTSKGWTYIWRLQDFSSLQVNSYKDINKMNLLFNHEKHMYY